MDELIEALVAAQDAAERARQALIDAERALYAADTKVEEAHRAVMAGLEGQLRMTRARKRDVKVAAEP